MRREYWLWIVGGLVVAALVATAASKDARTFVGEVVDKAGEALKDLIARFEGYSPTVYQDVAGLWTIGYGHLVKPGEPYHPYGPVTEITLEEAAALLEADTEIARRCVENHVTVPLTENQRAALISFVFNVGCGAFKSSTLLRRLNWGEYEAAAEEFDKWVNAGGVRVAGLVNRRAHEKETFLG